MNLSFTVESYKKKGLLQHCLRGVLSSLLLNNSKPSWLHVRVRVSVCEIVQMNEKHKIIPMGGGQF